MTRTSRGLQLIAKRAIDLFIAATALIFLWPIFLLVAVVIWVELGYPVIFRQQRPGRDGVSFHILKFRTMSNACDSSGQLLPDELRLGPTGKMIRSVSLDELPQLLNVLTGKMSLIGPRPLLLEYLPLYSKRQATRHEMRPGITGYAQVRGRNAMDWETRLELDAWYVENWSLLLDAKIALSTVAVVLSRRGVSQVGQVTVEKFRGNQDC